MRIPAQLALALSLAAVPLAVFGQTPAGAGQGDVFNSNSSPSSSTSADPCQQAYRQAMEGIMEHMAHVTAQWNEDLVDCKGDNSCVQQARQRRQEGEREVNKEKIKANEQRSICQAQQRLKGPVNGRSSSIPTGSGTSNSPPLLKGTVVYNDKGIPKTGGSGRAAPGQGGPGGGITPAAVGTGTPGSSRGTGTTQPGQGGTQQAKGLPQNPPAQTSAPKTGSSVAAQPGQGGQASPGGGRTPAVAGTGTPGSSKGTGTTQPLRGGVQQAKGLPQNPPAQTSPPKTGTSGGAQPKSPAASKGPAGKSAPTPVASFQLPEGAVADGDPDAVDHGAPGFLGSFPGTKVANKYCYTYVCDQGIAVDDHWQDNPDSIGHAGPPLPGDAVIVYQQGHFDRLRVGSWRPFRATWVPVHFAVYQGNGIYYQRNGVSSIEVVSGEFFKNFSNAKIRYVTPSTGKK